MLSTITTEGWVLMAGIGLPAVCLLFTALGLVFRKKKNPPEGCRVQQQAGTQQVASFGNEIDWQLLVQELDRRLVEICLFVQQERARLLMPVAGRPGPGIGDAEMPARQQDVSAGDRDAGEDDRRQGRQNLDIHGLVGELASKGLPAEQIARSLNLSVTEVDLMLRVRGRRQQATAVKPSSISAVV